MMSFVYDGIAVGKVAPHNPVLYVQDGGVMDTVKSPDRLPRSDPGVEAAVGGDRR